MSQQIPAAREHFLLATSLDPGFAPAWSGLPVGKVAALFRQTWHLSVTARGIIRAIQRAGQRARPTYQALVTAIHDSPMVVPDETGWRENGQSC
jgi:hypothetical protein